MIRLDRDSIPTAEPDDTAHCLVSAERCARLLHQALPSAEAAGPECHGAVQQAIDAAHVAADEHGQMLAGALGAGRAVSDPECRRMTAGLVISEALAAETDRATARLLALIPCRERRETDGRAYVPADARAGDAPADGSEQ